MSLSKPTTRAVWFGLVSIPSRMWGCNVVLESGAIYRNLPLHALAACEQPEPMWTAKDAQTWDCYGYDFSVLAYIDSAVHHFVKITQGLGTPTMQCWMHLSHPNHTTHGY